MAVARGRYILLLNSDTEVLDGAIDKAVRFADSRPEVGVVGCRAVFGDGRDQPTILRFRRLRYVLLNIFVPRRFSVKSRLFGGARYIGVDLKQVQDVDAVAGMFMLARREVYRRVGGMDERFFMFSEEVEWCFRIRRAGWSVLYYPDAVIIHHGGGSTRRNPKARTLAMARSLLIYFQLTQGRDAAYAANLLMLARDLPRAALWAVLKLVPTEGARRLVEALEGAVHRLPLHARGLFRLDWTPKEFPGRPPAPALPFSRRRLATAPARGVASLVLAPMERRLIRQAREKDWGPVCFVLGPPRSGTTLLYELLIRSFGFAYVCNLAHSLYTTPVAATSLARRWIEAWRRPDADRYKSDYGTISGWGAPNEGGNLWNQWFPREIFLDADYADRVPLERVRGVVAGIARVMGGPFLNKNVMHSVHMRLLDRLFPGCAFVHVVREPIANVRSIVRLRLEQARDASDLAAWRSVKPREWERFRDAHHAVQACAQVHFTHANIREDSALLGAERTLEVAYDRLCLEPGRTLEEIGAFLRGRGIDVALGGSVPESFPLSQGRPLDDETEERIAAGWRSLAGGEERGVAAQG
jgi:GT2 family glycosyltransferase